MPHPTRLYPVIYPGYHIPGLGADWELQTRQGLVVHLDRLPPTRGSAGTTHPSTSQPPLCPPRRHPRRYLHALLHAAGIGLILACDVEGSAVIHGRPNDGNPQRDVHRALEIDQLQAGGMARRSSAPNKPCSPRATPIDGLSLEDNERSLLMRALEKTNGNQPSVSARFFFTRSELPPSAQHRRHARRESRRPPGLPGQAATWRARA